jgi:hypothetical protein
MNPICAVFGAILLVFVALGTRRQALIATVAGVLYLTQGQAIDLAGLNLYAVRILAMALFLRVIARKEFSFSNLNTIDHALLMVYAYTTVVFLLRSDTGKVGIIAQSLDAIFCYFGFRGLIKSEDELRWLLRTLVFLLIPYATLILIERVTANNPFIFMGGIPGGWVRDGAVRCMGSFRYPVSLGTFAATFLALYLGLLHSKPDRKYAWLGVAFCLWIVWTTNSGGSLSATVVVLVGWVFWYARAYMRRVRWGIIVVLVALSLMMKAPVWFILNRGPFGGDAWHRAYLIDIALRHLGEWWLAGMPLRETADWFPYTVNGAADITNQYLAFGLSAGIGAVVLLVLLLSRALGRIGTAITTANSGSRGFLLWGLGVMMVVHVINWFGVPYFDQIYVIWFLQLAAVTSVTHALLDRPIAYAHEPGDLPDPSMEYAGRGIQ